MDPDLSTPKLIDKTIAFVEQLHLGVKGMRACVVIPNKAG